MKERVVTTVRIRHHRIKGMPHLARLQAGGSSIGASSRKPIEAPRGLLIALALSGMLWAAVIAAVSL
jgi:hypothetical protein